MTTAPFRKRNWMAGEQEWKARIPFHSTVFFLSLESCKCVVYSKINKSRMKKKKKKLPCLSNSVFYSLLPRFLRDPAGPQTAEREPGCIFCLRLPESLHHMLSEACFSGSLVCQFQGVCTTLPATRGQPEASFLTGNRGGIMGRSE